VSNKCFVIFDKIPYPILLLDRNMIIKNINSAGHSILSEDFIGKKLFDCPPFDISKHQEIFKKINSTISMGKKETLLIKHNERDFRFTIDKLEDFIIILIEKFTAILSEKENRIKIFESSLFTIRDTMSSLIHQLQTMKDIIDGSEVHTDSAVASRLIEEKNIVYNAWESGEYIRFIVDNLSFLSYLDQLKSFDKSDEIEVDLKDFFNEVISEEDVFIINKNLTVNNNIQENVKIKVIPEFTRHAFKNILHNSIKYSSKNDNITIDYEDQDGSSTLSILDNGIGISNSDLPRIKENFFRGNNYKNNKFPSSGTGLFIAQSIFDMSGWNMYIESMIDKGTKVNILIK